MFSKFGRYNKYEQNEIKDIKNPKKFWSKKQILFWGAARLIKRPCFKSSAYVVEKNGKIRMEEIGKYSREILVKRAASDLGSDKKVSSSEVGLCMSRHGWRGGCS